MAWASENCRVLANVGLTRADLGTALDALRKLVKQEQLVRFADAITKSLETSLSEEAFLLVVKAKPRGAMSLAQKASKTAWLAPC